ncbi:unnamed protein product [Rangifer tarandus platyrhynchus]|uniref:Uncharacterized protein n=1 Tax=Rangifer tarandus platyrhynchus TaxID=3082113 RepID=A0AC59Z845_RANTA
MPRKRQPDSKTQFKTTVWKDGGQRNHSESKSINGTGQPACPALGTHQAFSTVRKALLEPPKSGPQCSRNSTACRQGQEGGGEIERREPRGRGRPQGRGSGFFPRVPGSQGTERQPSRRPPSPRHKPASSDPKPSDFRLQPANQRRPRPAPAPEARPAPDAPFRPRRGVGGACEGLSGPGDFKGFSVEAP